MLAGSRHRHDPRPGILVVSVVVSIGVAASIVQAAHGPDVLAGDAAFRFLVMNDIHVTAADLPRSRAQLARAVEEINSMAGEIDFLLLPGDLAQSEDPLEMNIELEAVRQELDLLTVPYHVVPGNHDVTTAGSDSLFRTWFGNSNHRFEFQGVQFIGLRTAGTQSSQAIPTATLDSLDAFLAQIDPLQPLIVFAHHPLGPTTPFGASNRQAFYDRVAAYNLRAVFTGHFHGLFEEEREGVWYCTTPPLSLHRCNDDGSSHKGYRLVSVWPDLTVSSRFFELGTPPDFAAEAPHFARLANRYALANTPFALRPALAGPSSTPVQVTATQVPAGAAWDAATGLLTWVPGVAQSGLHDLQFVATNATAADTVDAVVRVLDSACVYDDFDPVRENWTAEGGTWSWSAGELQQQLVQGGSYFCTSEDTLGAVHLEADFMQSAGIGYSGVVFRYVDADNNYYLWNDGTRIQLRRRVAGKASSISDKVAVGPLSGWHHIRIEAVGSTLRVYLDGDLRIEVQDDTFSSGRVGFLCSQAAARFDNIVALGCDTLPNRPPSIQPIVPRTTTVGMPVTFTVQASDVDGDPLTLRAENLPAGASFDTSTRSFTWNPAPHQVGSWGNVAFRADDGELHDSEGAAFVVLDPVTCYNESFEDSAASLAWSPGGGNWSVPSGEYVGNLEDGGTLNTLALDVGRDYMIAARLRIDGPGYGNLAFRVQDAQNYYYLYTRNDPPEVQVRKMRGTGHDVLASGAIVEGGVEGVWHDYLVEVSANQIRVWVDQALVYSVCDPDLGEDDVYLEGGVGLRLKDATLRLDHVSVFGCAGPGDATVDVAPTPSPGSLELRAFPNPFNPQTTATFELSRPAHARLRVYSVAGRLVRVLHEGTLQEGPHSVLWNGRDDRGRQMSSGIYLIRLEAGSQHATRRVVLIK